MTPHDFAQATTDAIARNRATDFPRGDESGARLCKIDNYA